MSTTLIRWIDAICVALALLGGLIFIAEALLSVLSISGRALLGRPLPGDYELVQLMSAAAVVMCLPYCQRRQGHVVVSFFTRWAPRSFKRVLDRLALLLLAAVAFLLLWRSWHGLVETRSYGETTMVLAFPLWWAYLPLLPAFLMLGVAALAPVRSCSEDRAGTE